MKTRFKLFPVILTMVLMTGACATPDPSLTLPQVTFQHAQPLNLAVSRVETVSDYSSPLKAPNVEQKMDTGPAAAMVIWANDRLKAVAPSAPVRARMTIERAAIIETQLARTEGIKGAFTTDQSHRYDLEIQATVEIVDAAGQRLGHANTRATRSQTMPETATMNDLQQAWFKLMEDGLKDFDREMEANIRRFLATWVR